MTDRLAGRGPWLPAVAWGALAYGIHEVGNQTGLYVQYGWYQNLTHAASASALAGLVAVAGLGLGYRGMRLVFLVVGATVVGAVAWEAVEFFGLLDRYGVALHFHGFHDAAIDMAANVVGVSVTLAVLGATTGFGIAGMAGDTDPPPRAD